MRFPGMGYRSFQVVQHRQQGPHHSQTAVGCELALLPASAFDIIVELGPQTEVAFLQCIGRSRRRFNMLGGRGGLRLGLNFGGLRPILPGSNCFRGNRLGSFGGRRGLRRSPAGYPFVRVQIINGGLDGWLVRSALGLGFTGRFGCHALALDAQQFRHAGG